MLLLIWLRLWLLLIWLLLWLLLAWLLRNMLLLIWLSLTWLLFVLAMLVEVPLRFFASSSKWPRGGGGPGKDALMRDLDGKTIVRSVGRHMAIIETDVSIMETVQVSIVLFA